jgi:uncharacterized protein (DUF362 family)/Pyruvate/2-oxoacid:ferredoxin oxidoreductase delta subunit
LKKTIVSVARASDYDLPCVYSAIEKATDLIGGIGALIKPGNKVFVKINHLSPASPAERGIVTHPIFLEAALKLLKNTGADITVGDDIDSDTIDGFEVSGIRQACNRAGIKLVNLRENGFVETKCSGKLLDNVYLSAIALGADVIVNLPKLKTHCLTVFTGSIKNMFGITPRGSRIKCHYQYVDPADLSQALVDIFSALKPALTIMDGIIAMEGEGPSSGKLKKLGIVLASRDAVAVDAVASQIIGLDPLKVYTTKFASETGLGIGNLQDIEVVGERLEDIISPDFKLPASYSSILVKTIPKILSRFLVKQFTLRPKLIKRLCSGCLECQKICPAGAVSQDGNKVTINQDTCIRCLCCDEVCRSGAIIPTRSLAANILSSTAGKLKKLTARQAKKTD